MKMIVEEAERLFSVTEAAHQRGSGGGLEALCESSELEICQIIELSLQARVAERTRIARELHDTLLQRFGALLLRFQTVSDLLSTRPAEAKLMLASAIDQAAEALTEGRERVQGLRTSADELNDLATAIGKLSEELAAGSVDTRRTTFRVYVEGTARQLSPMVWDETYRIAAEAVRNAFQHSNGTQSEVELRYGKRQLRMRVRDDGVGIDGTVLAEGGRHGHHGLCGMRERAEIIGGKLTVWSAPGAGTEVELTIPASRAYKGDVPEADCSTCPPTLLQIRRGGQIKTSRPADARGRPPSIPRLQRQE
jgi:signal transduction histidine kinase